MTKVAALPHLRSDHTRALAAMPAIAADPGSAVGRHRLFAQPCARSRRSSGSIDKGTMAATVEWPPTGEG